MFRGSSASNSAQIQTPGRYVQCTITFTNILTIAIVRLFIIAFDAIVAKHMVRILDIVAPISRSMVVNRRHCGQLSPGHTDVDMYYTVNKYIHIMIKP